MVEVYAEGVSCGQTVRLENILNIPQIVMSTNTRYCNVVQVSYELKVEAEVPGCRQNIKIEIPITIGSVPLNDTRMVNVMQTMPSVMPSAPLPYDRKFLNTFMNTIGY